MTDDHNEGETIEALRKFVPSRFTELLRSYATIRNLVLLTIFAGVFFRLLFWRLYPPTWKVFAVFNMFDTDVIAHISDFESYKYDRIAFFDIFVGGFYLPFAGLFGTYALSLFTVVLSSLSLPVFYLATKRIFDRTVGLFALLLFALYPKGIVLAARAMPEGAAASFAVIALYGLVVGSDREDWRWHLFGSIAALASWLVYYPAVIFAILVTLYCYLHERSGPLSYQLIPGRNTLIYAVPSGIFGVLYLLYGPVSKILLRRLPSVQSQLNDQIFVNPEAYSTFEKIVRYFAYTYYEFWWHKQGFDQESHILRSFDRVSAFLGDLYLPYLLVWTTITGVLTLLVGYGLIVLVRRKTRLTGLLLAWMTVYLLIDQLRSLGWVGEFKTRQFFNIFPAIAILFGLGAAAVLARRGRPRLQIRRVLLFVAIGAILITLVFNAGVQGIFVAENYRLSSEHPTDALNEIAGPGADVAVLDEWQYYDVVIHSGGAIRPVIFQRPSQKQMDYVPKVDDRAIQNKTTLAQIRYLPPDELPPRVSYLYASSQCGEFGDTARAYINASLDAGGDVVYHQSVDRGSKCDINSIIISFSA